MTSGFQPPLMVADFIATRSGDPERGPMIRMRPQDAIVRLLQDGELARVHGSFRQELAVVVTDDSIPLGCIVARDIAGIKLAENVRVTKPDLDLPRNRKVG